MSVVKNCSRSYTHMGMDIKAHCPLERRRRLEA